MVVVESESEELDQNNPFLAYFHTRIKRNKNCIIAVVGETGSGKSYTALRLAERLDPNFNVDRVALKAEEFLKLLKEDMPKGSAIVFDECGVAWQSRNFMSFVNKSLSFALQTVRFKNHIIIMTVPDMSFIDVQGRKLIHMILITEKVLHKEKLVRLRPYIISINYREGTDYKITPRLYKNGAIVKMHKIEVGLPSVKLRHRYEKRKREYAEGLYLRAYAEITKDNVKSSMDVLTDKQKLIHSLDKAGISNKEIARITGMKLESVYERKSRIKRLLSVLA